MWNFPSHTMCVYCAREPARVNGPAAASTWLLGPTCLTCQLEAVAHGDAAPLDRKRLLRFLAALGAVGRQGSFCSAFLAPGMGELGVLLAAFLVIATSHGFYVRSDGVAVPLPPLSEVTEDSSAVAESESESVRSGGPVVESVRRVRARSIPELDSVAVWRAQTEREAAGLGRGIVEDHRWAQTWESLRHRRAFDNWAPDRVRLEWHQRAFREIGTPAGRTTMLRATGALMHARQRSLDAAERFRVAEGDMREAVRTETALLHCQRTPAGQMRMAAAARSVGLTPEEGQHQERETYAAAWAILTVMANNPESPFARYYDGQLHHWSTNRQSHDGDLPAGQIPTGWLGDAEVPDGRVVISHALLDEVANLGMPFW